MALTERLIVVPPREAASRANPRPSRLGAVWRRFLAELAALPDHGATLDDLPPEFFRFPSTEPGANAQGVPRHVK